MMKRHGIWYFKIISQCLMLLCSLCLIAVGLWGSQFAPKNITTLFVWVHYRGFLVLSLLFLGNLFCMSCPFIFVRNCLRVFISPRFLWPKKLQNKWLALFIFCAVLFFYEYLSLWSSPYKTALLIIGYFAAALLVDLLFKKASFCKYVCPIGQFNFLSSTLSFKEVAPKQLSVCHSCTTQDCLRGNAQNNLRGCELHLLMPKKHGNIDCTFCMDCIRACPHDNIAVSSVIPTTELWQETHRSGIGQLSQRNDILAFIVAFAFGGLLNAFLMTAPAFLIREKINLFLGLQNNFLNLLLFFLLFLLVLPAILLGPLLKFSEKNNMIPSLLPVGFAIWCSHYSFHLLTGFFTFIPLMTKASWPLNWMGLKTSTVYPFQMGILSLGFMGSVMVLTSISNNRKTRVNWIAVNFVVCLLAAWIFTSPMEMRGTFVGIVP